jgi:chromosome segregation ATPase
MDKNTETKNKVSRWQIFRKSRHNSTGHVDDIQRKRSPSFPSRPHKATISTIPKTTTQPIGLCVPNGEIIGQDHGSGSRVENSVNTQLVIAETERDQYKKEMEKRDREYQNEIVQLKVEMKKRAFSQMPMTINDRKGEDEVDVLKKRLKMIEEEKEAAEAQLRETIDSLEHQLNEFKLKNSRESEIFQQKQHLVTQIAKYKLKDQKQQEELREKEKQIMELNEKLSKRNVNIADLNEKLTELINENYISGMNNEKPNVVRAESDQDSAKQEVTEAYNEIQRQTNKISQLNEEIETLKQEHVEEKENLLTAINEQSNIIKRSEVDFNMMAREMDHKETELQELYDNLKKKCQTIDTLTEKVAGMYKTESALRAVKDDKQIVLEELTLKLQATEIKVIVQIMQLL